MVQHIGVGHKAISFHSVYRNAKNATADHHAHFRIFFQCKLSKFRHFCTDGIVVSGNVLDFVSNYILHGTAFQPLPLLDCVKYWEVRETLWQNVDELFEVRARLASFLHNKARKE